MRREEDPWQLVDVDSLVDLIAGGRGKLVRRWVMIGLYRIIHAPFAMGKC